MFIETTINMNTNLFEILTQASIRTGESKRNIISSLLRRLSQDFKKIDVPWRRISYQKRDSKKSWRRLHLVLMPDEYEFFLDLRKVCKMSISRLAAHSIEEYLAEIIDEFNKGTDNYRYSNYSISCFIHNGIVCLVHYWGMAETLYSRHFLEALKSRSLTFSGG